MMADNGIKSVSAFSRGLKKYQDESPQHSGDQRKNEKPNASFASRHIEAGANGGIANVVTPHGRSEKNRIPECRALCSGGIKVGENDGLDQRTASPGSV
jgi:hypothetical protein